MVGKNFYLYCMDKKNEQLPLEPTKSELEILQVLWEIGPATVRAVNDELLKKKEVNYSTTLKFMQIMAEKGLLNRDDSRMKHVYNVAVPAEKAKAELLDKFVNAMYKGSTSQLMMQLLGNKNTSRQDLQDIKEMIKKLEEE